MRFSTDSDQNTEVQITPGADNDFMVTPLYAVNDTRRAVVYMMAVLPARKIRGVECPLTGRSVYERRVSDREHPPPSKVRIKIVGGTLKPSCLCLCDASSNGSSTTS